MSPSRVNPQSACFVKYAIIAPTNGDDYDGMVNNSTGGIIVSPAEITAQCTDNSLKFQVRR